MFTPNADELEIIEVLQVDRLDASAEDHGRLFSTATAAPMFRLTTPEPLSG